MDDCQSVSEVAQKIPNTWTRKPTQVASAPPGPLSDVTTKLMENKQKVDRNWARWIRLGCEWPGRRTILPTSEERRQARWRKITARPSSRKPSQRATKVVEKANAEAQSWTAKVREDSDGRLSSRTNCQIEQFEKSTEAILSAPQDASERVARHHAEARVKVKTMTTTKRMSRMKPRSLRPVTNRRDPVETRR